MASLPESSVGSSCLRDVLRVHGDHDDLGFLDQRIEFAPTRLAFPGLARGQRLVARDEARHIGIGVSYTRRRMETDPERAREVIGEVVAELLATAGAMLETANNGMAELVVNGYGVHPQAFYDEAIRLTQLRLRSVGFLD